MKSRFFRLFAVLILLGLLAVLPHRKTTDSTTTKSEPSASARQRQSISQPSTITEGDKAAQPTEAEPATDFGAWASEKIATPDLAKIDAFQVWAERWKKAAPEDRAAMAAEGELLAKERRAEFKALIATNPRAALAQSVPRVIRQDLPKEIVASLEKPVSATGNYQVYMGRPAPGMPIPDEGLTLRYFETPDGMSYKARVFGEMEPVMSRKQIPLRGVSIDRELAVAESPVRQLEIGERIATGTVVEDVCPVSGKTTEAVASNEPVTEETPTVELGERLITLCNGSHVTVIDEKYRTLVQASGPGGAGFYLDNFPGTSSKAIGNFRCLYIRVTYPDQMTPPNTEDQGLSDMKDVARYYREASFGKLSVTSTVTPLITLPQTLAWYIAKDAEVDGLAVIHNQARAEARKLGYDSTQYNCIIVRVNGGLRSGASWGGGDSVWAGWGGMDVLNHECGHSLGLNHANYWSTTDGTAYGTGANEEYGNPYDVMGGSGGFSAHYNTISKRALGWLPANYYHSPATNGVYRIYAYDQPTLEEGKRYALTVAKDSVRQYNVEYHPARGGLLNDSALVLYSGMGSNAGHLLDTTPGSAGGKNDAGIAVGRTFSDLEADMHFTVLSKNTTTPPSIDVAYFKGPFPGNVAPTATFTASANTINAGDSVTFTATASDSNGDALSYHWEFSDGVAGDGSSTFTRVFVLPAQVTAMLTVSDMKGGTVRRSTVINVGAHGKQTVSGTVTLNSQPLPGVYVSGSGLGCYTNVDGTYSLAGQPIGSVTLAASLNGYTFTPSVANPLTVVAGTNTVNWTATGSTFVTLANVADPAEGGASGTFRLTRIGDTSGALTVLVSPVGGTATKTTDYTFTPDYTASGSFFAFTIPAGSATLDIAVAVVNDSTAEGPETITLQLASAAGYLSGSGNAVVMTVGDNDTSLPLVRVTAPDPYAVEGGSDTGTFIFTRTGVTTSAVSLTVAWTGTATNGTDYSTLPTTVTIPANSSSTTVTVTPLNDSAAEVPETIIATISANNTVYLRNSAATTSTITLTDDDTPQVTVSAPDSSASEAGPDSGVFLITRSGPATSALKVYYGISGSALHGTDYAMLNGEVTIPAGSSSAPVVILPIDDDLAEPSENVTLAVTTFDNAYSVGAAFQSTVTIADNADKPLVAVRAGTVGVEGSTNATLIFRGIGNSLGNVTVNYTVSGTATPGSDYTALSGSVSIPANGTNDVTVTIPVTDDLSFEAAETVKVTITPSASYSVYNDGTAEAVIRDNEGGTERVSVSAYNDSPAEASSVQGRFYFSRTGTVGALTVNYAISGTANSASDYTGLSGTAVIPDGQSGVNVTFVPLDDSTVEGSESVTVTVSPGAGYSPDRPASATLFITDNETSTVTVGFQALASANGESPGVLGEYRDVPVVLSAASANPISVSYTGGGGTAMGDDVDWTFADASAGNAAISEGTLTFAPGVTTQNIRVRIKNDLVREPNEYAVLRLVNPVGASFTTSRNQHNLFIFDEVPAGLVTEERWNATNVYTNNTWNTVAPDYTGFLTSFTPDQNVANVFSRRLTGLITAPTTGAYTFWIASDNASRLFISTDSTAANKVQRASLATATSFQNWTANSSQQSISLNLTAGQSYYVEVQHQETGGSDHVSVAWQGPGFSRTPILTPIPDNAPRVVRFAVDSSTCLETDASAPMLMAILDRPAGATAVTVNYTTSGTAISGTDYTLTPGTLTFNPGEQFKLLPLTFVADSVGEAPESLIVSLSSPVGAAVSSPATHLITLLDPGTPVVNTVFASATSSQTIGTVIATSTATVISPRVVSSWSIIAGNPNNAFAINSAGQVTLALPGSLPNPGNVQLVVRATDDLGSSGDGAVNIVCNPPSGQAVTEQRWSGSSAYDDQIWSGTPIYSGTLPSLTSAQGVGDNYSRRIVGYLKPTVSGIYYFWTASDDQSRLYLGSNGYESSKALIATVNDWTAFQGWDEETNQISSGISLVAGQTYWIEAQQVEGGGGDHVSVAWQGPGIARQPIPATVMAPFVAGAASGDPTPQAAIPVVAITSPTNSASFFSTNNITVTASVTSNGQTITGLEFYRDNVLIGTDTVAPYEATYANATAAASVNLTARALYLDTFVTSPSVNIVVQDSNPPVVASRYFAANSGMSANTALGSATATLSSPRTLSLWAIVAGNTGSIFSINSTSGQISLQQPSSLPAPGMIYLTVRATDSAGYAGDGTIGIFCNSTGSSVWVNANGGSWPTGGNWSNSTAVTGASSVADFSVLDLTANAAVTLDGARTVGTLVFGDTSARHNWTLSTGSAGPLTLNTTTGNPVVTVNNQTATLNLVVAGTKGLIKNGAGTLALGGINTFTGGLTVNAGTVSLQPGDYNNALPTNSAVTINNGGTVIHANTNVTNNGIAFTVNAGGTLSLTSYHAHVPSLTLNGGAVVGSGSGKYNGEDFALDGNVTVGGTTASSISIANGIGFGSRTFTVADATTSPAADLTISGNGAIKGTGILTKAGVGTMAVSSPNTYSGGTNINAGTFLATNVAGSATGTGAVTVAASATIGGNGTVSGAVSISGGLAPGVNDVGALTVGGTLTLAGTSTSTMQLAKAGAALSNDRVLGATTLTFGGRLTVSASGDALTVGDSFDLFDAITYSGSFTTVNLPTLSSGLVWNTTQLNTAGIILVETGVLPQTITFGTLATKTFGDAPFSPGATASSGLTVSYSSSAPAVASVSESTITILSAGTATITASQSGNAGYLPATSVDQILTVNKASQAITFGALAARTFGSGTFSLAGSASSGLPVSYQSSNTSVATIAGNTVTIVGAGTTTITASQAGDSNYLLATPVPQTLTVSQASQTITFGSIATKTFGSGNFSLAGSASSGLSVGYQSLNPAVATISGSTVTIVGAGTATITASQVGNASYLAATPVDQVLTVNKAAQTITFGALTSKTFGDATFNLGATASSALSASYLSSNPDVATIAGNTVTIVGAGTTTITASQAGDTNYLAATSVPQTLTVNKASQAITFAALDGKTFGDAIFSLNATSDAGLPVSYSSSNNSIATVSGSLVTIVGAGTVNITASQAGSENHMAASDVVRSLTIAQASATVGISGLAQTYDGLSKPVTTSTTPFGLAVSVTYNGSATVPVAAGSYAVVATINDSNHVGSNAATLVITNNLVVSGSQTLVLPNATATYQSLLNDGTLVLGAGTLHITGNATNNGVIRLTGNAVFDVSGTFTNAGVIDIINWSGTLPPGIVGSGTILDRSAIKVISTQSSATQFTLSVPSYAGHLYQLESKADLSGAWVPLGAPVPGTGGALNPPAMQFTPALDGPRRFYRVVVSPAP